MNPTSTRSLTLDVDRFEALAALQEEGQPDVLAEMVGLFVDETVGWLIEARNAADSGDMLALGRVAHSLKGACATIGAERMRAQAAGLEEALAAGRLSEAPSFVDLLTDEFRNVRTQLVSYTPGGRGEDRIGSLKR
jgi:HPt (histidine-containing phosphotransfer) domain-containing protein